MEDPNKDENVNSNPVIQSVEETDTTVSAQAQPEVPVAPAKKSSKKRIIWIIATLLVLVGLGLGGYYLVFSKEESATPTVSTNPATDGETTTEQKSNVPQFLLEQGAPSSGVAVGYIKLSTDKTSMSGYPVKLATAQTGTSEITYQPAIFYTNSGNIFTLNTETKETKQVTNEGGSNPVFSSMAQKLAFTRNTCDVYLRDIATNGEPLIRSGQGTPTLSSFDEATDDAKCYTPLAWSPDGKNLLMQGVYSINNSEFGLVGLSDLYIYNLESGSSTKLIIPDPFNTTDAGTFSWLNDHEITGYLQEFGAYATVVAKQLSVIDISTGDVTKVGDAEGFLPNTVKTVGDASYILAGDYTTRIDLYTGKTGDSYGNFTKINTDNGIGTFLLKTNDASDSVESVVYMQGSAGTENSFTAYEISPDGADSKKLFAPKSYSSRLLGWGLNYDEIIYMDDISGKTEIKKYTISSNTDEVLISDLPLIQ